MAIQRASMLSRLRLLLYLCAKAAEFSTQEKKGMIQFPCQGMTVFFFLFFFCGGNFKFACEKLFPAIPKLERRAASMLTKEMHS